MIIVRLSGGLGNQMFQYAAGKNLAVKNHATLKLDLSDFGIKREKITPRFFALNCFNISAGIASKKEIKALRKTAGIKNKIKKLLGIKQKSQTMVDPCYYFLPEVLQLKDNTYLDGFWQSEKYFKGIENIIRQEFSLKKEFSGMDEGALKQISESESIAIHIRRGDYVTNLKFNASHGVCPLEYYFEAVRIMENKIKNPRFFVFSDDLAWAKDNLKINHPITFLDSGQDYHDLILMSRCKHNIIANSSFSWWGAWLNNNPDKIVIAPKKWFRNAETNLDDRLPPNWIKI